MDIHFFKEESCLVVVSQDAVLFVCQNGVHRHVLSEEFSTGVDCVSFDSVNKRIAFSNKRNIAIVLLPEGEDKPLLQFTAVLERNCSTMSWSPSGTELVAGDKSGGIWVIKPKVVTSNKVATLQLDPTIIASRVAVVLALSLSGKGSSKFLAVGDRDGRLSIFHYPATHNLHQVCLGHSQYIAALSVPDAEKWPNYIMSLGGDGLVCLWDMVSGLCAARVSFFDENSPVLSKNRPKSLLFVKSTTDADDKRIISTWMVFGEDSTIVYVFKLSGFINSEDPKFEMTVEDVTTLLTDISFESSICAAATYVKEGCSSVVFVTSSAGKSKWPWKCLPFPSEEKSSATTLLASKLEKLAHYLAVNNNKECSFTLRPPRLWLERNPHQHVHEYYAKRKKTKCAKDDSLPSPACSDSDTE